MKTTRSVWLMHCTNPKCGFSLEKTTGEPDVICQSCGGFVAVTEHIKFVEEGNKEHDDLRSN
jgi:hypothetical protein